MKQLNLLDDFWQKTNDVLLDTNTLLIYLAFLPEFGRIINLQKRLSQFTGREKETIECLMCILKPYKCIYTNNCILSEISNLSDNSDKKNGIVIHERLIKLFVNDNCMFKESILPIKSVVSDKYFCRLGYTDSYILNSPEVDIGVVTLDLHLYLELSNRNIPVINFNHHFPWI